MNLIKVSHLYSLGLTDEIIFMCLVIIGILLCYWFSRPIIAILVSLKSETLLTYILSGFLFIVILFAIVLVTGDLTEVTYQLVVFSLQGISLLGAILFITQLMKKIIAAIKR